jgi:hypothetical protein
MLHSDSTSVFPRASSRRHGHRLVADYIAAPTVPVSLRSRHVAALAAQEEGAATAVEEAQEEAAGGQVQEEEPAEEVAHEEQGAATEASSDDDGGAGTGSAEAEAGSATKLYFGNLPYNCDSALLAGIVQDHAVPEMVEVCLRARCLLRCITVLSNTLPVNADQINSLIRGARQSSHNLTCTGRTESQMPAISGAVRPDNGEKPRLRLRDDEHDRGLRASDQEPRRHREHSQFIIAHTVSHESLT